MSSFLDGTGLSHLLGKIKDNSGKVTITSFNSTSLSAGVGKYYYKSGTANTLTVTLPTVTGAQANGFIIVFKTGSSPNVTFTSTEQTSISYADGYLIEANTWYELNLLWNGTYWSLNYIVLGDLETIG